MIPGIECSVTIGKEIAAAQRAKVFAGIGFRTAECNSCYHGGQPGVSNAYASALWGTDYMLTLAQGGHAGVNLHGGGEGIYSPITGDSNKGFTRQPLYYGMKFAQSFAGATILAGNLYTDNANLTAYAGRLKDELLVALINKDAITANIALSNASLGKIKLRELWKLSAPSIESHVNVTFARTELDDAAMRASNRQTFQLASYTAVIARYS